MRKPSGRQGRRRNFRGACLGDGDGAVWTREVSKAGEVGEVGVDWAAAVAVNTGLEEVTEWTDFTAIAFSGGNAA